MWLGSEWYFSYPKTDKILILPDVPGAPGRPEITDYDNKSVDLKFTAPTSDGGAPLIKYIIQKKDK
jgi:hypothetical protein